MRSIIKKTPYNSPGILGALGNRRYKIAGKSMLEEMEDRKRTGSASPSKDASYAEILCWKYPKKLQEELERIIGRTKKVKRHSPSARLYLRKRMLLECYKDAFHETYFKQIEAYNDNVEVFRNTYGKFMERVQEYYLERLPELPQHYFVGKKEFKLVKEAGCYGASVTDAAWKLARDVCTNGDRWRGLAAGSP